MTLFPKPFTWKIIILSLIIFTACGEEQEAVERPVETLEPAPAAQLTPAPQTKINLNTATEEEFLTIPDVGDRMVGEFMEYRPYVSIQQFRQEIGKYVDEAQVAAYEQYVFVPVDPNESDAATLQQLPGVDETEANELIAGRPYASRDAFLEELAAYVESGDLEAASSYLTAQ